MFCPRCSSVVEDGASVCPSCGDDLRRTATTPGGSPLGSGDAPLDFAPGAIFGDRYTIIEKAGQGGMGIVYKAIDTALDLVVALKLIRPRLASLPRFVERFKHEVRLTRQVTHPNVCRVHDLGESRGIHFLSMEWIEGETLRQLLNQAGPLDPTRALAIAAGIADALVAAHGKGIVHRDLKPENVMIDDSGAIFVMDFGLAVGLGPESFAQRAGSAAGTPGYMSPEQRRGEALDARSDLFSLGLMLAEMLTGRAPDPARPLPVQLPPALGKHLAPVLGKLLALQRAERYTTAEEAVRTLQQVEHTTSAWRDGDDPSAAVGRKRRLVIAAAGAAACGALLLVALVLVARWTPRARPDLSPAGSMANPAKAAAASPDGVSSAASSALSPAEPSAGASPASSARAFYERGIGYLSEASDELHAVDDAVHMLRRAVDAEPAFALGWAGLSRALWARFQLTREDAARNEAERAVAEAMRLSPTLPEAHFVRGLGYLVEANHAAARAEFEAAVEAKPGLHEAWAGLGRACREEHDYAAGLKALHTAIDLKPDRYQYQIALGNFHEHFEEQNAAAQAYEKALALNPRSRSAWNNIGAALMRIGRPAQAVAALRLSLEIEESASARANLGTAYFHQRKYSEAEENYRLAAKLDPRRAVYQGNIGDALEMLGQSDAARKAYLAAARLARLDAEARPGDAAAHEELGLYCAKAKEAACALDEAKRAYALQPGNAKIVFANAVIRSLLGRTDEALQWLQNAARLGITKAEIENEPGFAPLRADPRYKKILDLAS